MRIVKVLVECDPSHDIFRGFRIGKDCYTEFSVELLEGIVERLPALERVEYDGWPSVMREGPLMRRLVEVARKGGKSVVEVGARDSVQGTCRTCINKTQTVCSLIPA